ncbi:hypothetical protein Pst134EA_022569 [Puccinia striiformis f. sp. tritici]|uniref:hypothetical protein n=1 Tax=Puccinia striiformis f. sp. tritici TaxID=168172 RepID=UPI0020073D31|nr:hypothetical protein Pst134EA_022569 [Puccinia striiformis f. sp. tritici]KAH9455093.1 hypothetical protein Pst134EA_022569 [Puccinia striiformis f. sp. tritici]KAI9611273.1 hypothetical protein KEM48_004513 [Puccinia striiformis f. sp. tritici PST-130]
MSLLRPFEASDIFRFNHVNLDAYTETYSVGYYLQYLCTWPDLMNIAESPNHQIMGYVMGKMEGENEDFHGHVSAITVAPSYRRLSLARELMKLIELASEQQSCYFVDLFVRNSNSLAISMYEHFGYSVYQRVVKYYSGGGVGDNLDEEDAYDMRKALSLDKDRKSVRENGKEVYVDSPSF